MNVREDIELDYLAANMKNKNWILFIIVISQFCCTSLWFAGNGVMQELVIDFGLGGSALANLTSAVQFGFITGTLIFAFFTIADRFSPSFVFFISALLGAIINLGTILNDNTLPTLLIFRFFTGFFLAGIYPVGMKIAADYFEKGLGRSLGYLVGALVVGTAFPHLLKGFIGIMPWRIVIIFTSFLAVAGGFVIWIFVPDGPYRKNSDSFDFKKLFKVFRNPDFRSAAFGYFGHMWELYAFWAFVPFILMNYIDQHPASQLNVPVWSFFVIGMGGLACVLGGYLSMRFGARRIAAVALALSGLCCVLSPVLLGVDSIGLLLGFLIFWGLMVVADSPLFSSLVANNTIAESKGTALTIVNCIGFSITIISIQLLNVLLKYINPQYAFMILALGPVLGLISLYKKRPDYNKAN